MRRRLTLFVLLVAGLLAGSVASASAAPKDFSATALNIIPSGQLGSFPVPDGADEQANMYDALTPLFDNVKFKDLGKYFKSTKLDPNSDGPLTVEPRVTIPNVTIYRDRFDVPHVKATTYDAGIRAAGWIAASDREILLMLARTAGCAAAVDAPGLTAIGLIGAGLNFDPSPQAEAEIAKQADALRARGKEGRAVLRDIDTFVSGINAWLDANSPLTERWTRNDIFCLNSLKSQFLGQGGGDEARRSQFLGGLIDRLGAKKGWQVFNDLRQQKNNGSPTTIDGNFPYAPMPTNGRAGSVILDAGSYEPRPSLQNARLAATLSRPEPRQQASNTLMVTRNKSASGKPMMVGGPQIGYFYPGFTYEINMDAPNLKWRGATSAPFPGYLLIGRTQDYATTLTSASGDVVDQYVEKLCEGSDIKYVYNGECRDMEFFEAGSIGGAPVNFYRTVHGPVVGYATVDGERVAISSKRSSYGRDVVDLLFNRRLSNGSIHNPKDFFNAAAQTPQTFNSFYIDSRNVAEFTSGRLPMRHPQVDPGLPTWGTGQYEWQGFLSKKGHPQGVNPKSGLMVNWNNSVAHRFGSADDEWGRAGSVQRVDLLNRNLQAKKGEDGKWNMTDLVEAMNMGGTQDVRAMITVPLLRQLLRGTQPPTQVAGGMLRQMVLWKQEGGSRLDRDLDGKIDAPGAASMDAAWDGIADAVMGPVLGPQLDELDSLFSRFDAPPSGQYAGWYQYFHRDIRKLLGLDQPQPFKVSYCGNGDLAQCQSDVWDAIADAGVQMTAEQGSSTPVSWRADATAERISFAPGLFRKTLRYTNRPSGIQQVISFKGDLQKKR
jgi:acyl-homoserine lactone acylase PvdQ